MQDINQSGIINDNNKYTSAILANIEAIRTAAAAAAATTTTNSNNNNSTEVNEFQQKVSVSQNALDNFLNNQQQHFDFLRRSSCHLDASTSNTTSFLNENNVNVITNKIEECLPHIGNAEKEANDLNYDCNNEEDNDGEMKDSHEYEDYENSNDVFQIDRHQTNRTNDDNTELKIPPSVAALMFKNGSSKDLSSLIMLRKNIQNEMNERCETIKVSKQNTSAEYYNSNSDSKNSTSNRINMASIFQNHPTLATLQHDNETFHQNDVVEQQQICHQQQQLVAE